MQINVPLGERCCMGNQDFSLFRDTATLNTATHAPGNFSDRP